MPYSVVSAKVKPGLGAAPSAFVFGDVTDFAEKI
jgi:hypothetical protein